mgnify:CR=1 FL=1
MATLSTLSTPIATPLVNEDGTINAVWNEFFIRFMINAGITVSIDDLEADVSDLVTDVENVADEITASVTITDSDNNIASDTAKLYNGNKTSDGVEYTITTTTAKYIQYKFGIEDYVDRVSLWTDDADGRVFIAYSTNGTTWSYLSAEADHTLTSEGRLETATSEANATTEYWQLAAGVNLALFPNNTVVKYVRLYMVSGTYTTTIYELIFARMLIAEMAAIENIYALSATFGPMSGYADITDKPTTLAGINLTEGDKLNGIADGADVTDYTSAESFPAVVSASMTRTGSKFERTTGTGWDAQAYSTIGYTGGIRVSFTPDQADKRFMIGLDEDPDAGSTYLIIDYCFYCINTGNFGCYESGSYAFLGTYVAGDLLELVYTGTQIIYYKNGVSLRTVSVDITNPLYMDSSFYDPGGAISNVKLEPFATNNTAWEHSSDITTIDGGKIHADSQITIGNTTDGDYCDITAGDIDFFYWVDSISAAVPYKSLKRREEGIAENADVVEIPGYFKTTPNVDVIPKSTQTFVFALLIYEVDQVLQCQAENIEEYNMSTGVAETGTNSWRFTVKALLIASSAGVWSDNIPNVSTSTPSDNQNFYWINRNLGTVYSDTETTPSNTTEIIVSGSVTLAASRGMHRCWTDVYCEVTVGDTQTTHLIDDYKDYTISSTTTSRTLSFSNVVITVSSGVHSFRFYAVHTHHPHGWDEMFVTWARSLTNLSASYTFTPDAQGAAGDVKWIATGE